MERNEKKWQQEMDENKQKWRQALQNSDNRYRYFMNRNNEAEYELNKLRSELHWKNQDLQVFYLLETYL